MNSAIVTLQQRRSEMASAAGAVSVCAGTNRKARQNPILSPVSTVRCTCETSGRERSELEVYISTRRPTSISVSLPPSLFHSPLGLCGLPFALFIYCATFAPPSVHAE
ncbi:hypothetical protein TSAR_005965 [Trichomalopsis sarcophagae]|uniref:Uncharacterized protein n=1 Tax=Trichomalopsis sarcophagae TaxID=543379 RepID=A0A232EIF6_9HYME|nr:hypothetical protein TSAR_005965 [Trichomalopsis sarcophagae]